MTEARILLFQDNDEIGQPLHERYNDHHNIPAALCSSPRQCWDIVHQDLSGVDAAIMHKDMGQHNDEGLEDGITPDAIIAALHEHAPWVRVIITSGEYPHGFLHVLEMGADAYANSIYIEDWVFAQAMLGAVTPDEISRRHNSVETPYGTYPYT